MKKKADLYFRLILSLTVNILSISFVGWKTTECLIKYFNYPKGTTVDIKHSGNTAQFPAITICPLDTDEKARWNLSHLSKCGIQG